MRAQSRAWLFAALGLAVPGTGTLFGAVSLLEATHRDETAAVIALLEDGADPNQANRYGVMALSLACQNGNEKTVRALLEAGADPNASLPGGETVLMTAARTGRPGPVEALLEAGAKVDATESRGQTALMWAADQGHAAVVKLLLAAGADPDRRLESGFTPLLFAARNGHQATSRLLLEAGVEVNEAIPNDKAFGKAPPRGTTALRLAVENGHYDLAVLLLEAGADPNDRQAGFAPLHLLTWVRKPHRGDGDDGLPPPQGSGELGSLEFARLLVEKFDAEVDLPVAPEGSGDRKFGKPEATAFLLAAHRADLPYLKLLHELGADPDIANNEGTNAILAAAGVGSHAPEEEAGTERERLETLAWLVDEIGLEVNAVNKRGETAMHGAAYKNVPEVATWLDGRGAEIDTWNRKNKRGWTPLLIAQGFRPGNFKPDAATIEALEIIMRRHGVEPPPAPKRPVVGKPKAYEP